MTRINNTRVELATLPEIIKTLQDVLTFTKQWASVIGLMIILVVGLILLVRKLQIWRRQQPRQQQAMVQALLAIEAGTSPQVWLSMLDR